MLTRPPKIVYSTLKAKVGNPKDYTDNNKEKVFDKDCPKARVTIPKEVIQQQIIADGGEILEDEES